MSRQMTFAVTITLTDDTVRATAVADCLQDILQESGVDPASDIFTDPRVKFIGLCRREEEELEEMAW